jgi:hypothetical protein
MVLDARHRSSTYQKLVPLLGDDDANALMSEFPSYDGDELVTKQFLRAELALTKGDLRKELALTRTELRAEIADLRLDLAAVENRLTIRVGAAIGASTSMLAALALLT